MFDFSSLMPHAALSLVATLAPLTPQHVYVAADALPLTEFHAADDSLVIAQILAYNAMRDLKNREELRCSYKNLTENNRHIGNWDVAVARTDLPAERFLVPTELTRLDNERLAKTLDTGINACSQGIVVQPNNRLFSLEKVIQGQNVGNMSVGLMHACFSAKTGIEDAPAVGFHANGHLHVAIAGEPALARIDFFLTRTA